MKEFTKEQLRERAFYRVAQVLHGFWEEQQYNEPRSAAVHSRLFDTLVYDEYITLGVSVNGRGHREHIVPCAYIRDLAFKMYWNQESVENVARMVGRLLRIAHISKDEAKIIDLELGYKSTMPEGWNPETDSIFRRLEIAGIRLAEEKNVT